MTIELPESQVIDSMIDEVPNLRVSIIYEDFASGLRAKDCLDRMTRHLDVGPDIFSVRLWSFNYLSDPDLRNQAAKEAQDFEIIFLATRGSGEPPASVKNWMTEWLKHRDARPCALAIMPDEQWQKHPGGTALLKYISRVADSAGLDLVCPPVEPAEQPSGHTIRQIVRRAINSSPLLEGIVDDWQSYTHSGINE
jgi:hypothetical protein